MINSVQNFKTIEHNPFVRPKGDYYLTSETAKDIFESTEKKNEHKGKKVGIIIAGASLLTAAVVFALTKGLPKNTYKWLESLGQRIDKNVKQRKLRGETGPVTSFFNYMNNKMGKFIDKSRSINNFTSFKDLLFMKLMSKTAPTRKIHSKITEMFERLARRTVKRRYKTSEKKFGKLFDYYKNANEKILSESPDRRAVVQEMEKRLSSVRTKISDGFGKDARISRYSKMKKTVVGLDKRVMDTGLNGLSLDETVRKNLNHIKNSQIHQSFIAEDLLSAQKAVLTNEVSALKNPITEEINQMLAVYEDYLPKKDFIKLKNKTHPALKSFNNAVATENDKFFDKLRDLSLGSAPTDVLTILGSVGGVAVGLTKADNKDERISATLKYGIPIVGTLATSLAMTVGLVSGGKAMAAGLASGWVMNRIGTHIDKHRKHYNKQQEDIKHAEAVKAEIITKTA